MSWESKYQDELIEAILDLEDAEEAKRFLVDLCSRNELVLMQQRYAVARMLYENRTYQDIAEATGASTATISRVSRALNYGEGGYTSVIKRQKNADSQ